MHNVVPSTLIVTDATSDRVSLADAVTWIVPDTVVPLLGKVILTLGAVLSTVTSTDDVVLLLAASLAVAEIV